MKPRHADPYHEDNPPSLSGLGLLGEPFADTTAGHFFFADADGAQRLDLMLHLAPYSPLLVIAGKPGVGKTALLRQFAARASDTWRVAVVTARVDMGRDELLRDMARGFGLPLDSRVDHQELYAALIAQLRALRQNSQVPILLLDDAQYLGATMMELILKLCSENDNGHILSILLFGTPQLQNLLDSPALAARVTHTFEVTPFGEEETGAYIRHRLRAAGATDDGPFDAVLINKIHAASGGIPARINEMAQRMLTDKTLGGKERKVGRDSAGASGSRSIKRLALIAAAVVVVLMVVGPLRTALFKSNPPTPTAPQQSGALELPPPLIVGEEDHVKRPASQEPTPAEEPPAPAPTPTPEAAAPSTEAVEPLPLPPLSPAEEAPAEEPVPTPAMAAPQAAPAPAPAKPPARAEAPPVAKPLAVKEKPSPPPAAGAGIHGEAWVQDQPSGHYTLQLMALKEEATARQFIEMQHVQDKAAYFPVHRDGHILYVVVYGVYPDHGAAARAAKELPAKWGTPNPWVRSFKNLQGEFGK